MKQSILMVQRRDDTRWHVCETGPPKSLASFGLKEDAIEYARDLARTWSPEPYYQETEANGGGKSADAEEATLIGAHTENNCFWYAPSTCPHSGLPVSVFGRGFPYPHRGPA
jgi:hypothetical protein